MEQPTSAHIDTFCRDRLPPPEHWPELTAAGYPDPCNCAALLLEEVGGLRAPEHRCLLSPTERWDYGQLRHRANQVAQLLRDDLGLVPGNRVLLRGPNNPWLVACWFGVLQAGGVVVTTMPMLRAPELSVIGEISRPTVALCDHRLADDLVAAGMSDLDIVCYGGGGPDDLTARCAGRSGQFAPVPTAADDVALIAFTSGTTGRPKATLHFHRDVMAIADTFSRHVLQPTADDLFAGTPPIGFTFGLGGSVVFPLHAGAAALLLEKASPTELADAVADHGVTVLFTAPTGYRAMLAAGKAEPLRGLRRCVSAGETLPAVVWHDFHQATGVGIIDGIGATEMLHVFIAAADDDIRPGATGRVVPGYEATVLDDAGRPVPDGTAGRLAVKGPTGCRYLSDERQLDYVQGGWNITGDTYVRDADGYFWFQARSDDMIVSSGYNIAGPEVEQALLGHPDVLECGVVGAPDEQRGMVVTAYVVLRDGVRGDACKAVELQQHVKRTIAPYKYPRVVEFVEQLPRTATGKLKRYELRERAAGPAVAAPGR